MLREEFMNLKALSWVFKMLPWVLALTLLAMGVTACLCREPYASHF